MLGQVFERSTAKFTLCLDRQGFHGRLFLSSLHHWKKGAGHENPQNIVQDHPNPIHL
jgi:hypothetical protein